MKCACPSCQAVLQLPEPTPDRVRCPKCSTVIAVRAPAAAPAAPSRQAVRPAPAPVSSFKFDVDEPAYQRLPRKKGNGLGAAVVIGLVVVLAAAGGVVAFVMLQGAGETKTDNVAQDTKDKDKDKKDKGVRLTDTGKKKDRDAAGKGTRDKDKKDTVSADKNGGGKDKKDKDAVAKDKVVKDIGDKDKVSKDKDDGGKDRVVKDKKDKDETPIEPPPIKDKDEPRAGIKFKDKRVQEAFDRGVGFLTNELLNGEKVYYYPDPQPGSDVGTSALAGLTLLECGLPPDAPAVRKALDYVHASEKRLRFTYSLALTVMFLDRVCQARQEALARLNKNPDRNGAEIQKLTEAREQDVNAIRRVTARLLAAQNVKGGWNYYCRLLPPVDEEQMLKVLTDGEPFTPKVQGRDDNSINQFVMLALWTARRHGLKTDSALLRIEQRYRDAQNSDGSWGYLEKDKNLKDATTCAGLIGLAIGAGVKNDANKDKEKPKDLVKEDPNIGKGMEYLAKAVGRTYEIEEEVRNKRLRDTATMLRLIKEYIAAPEEDRADLAKQLEKLDRPEYLKGTLIAADAWGDLYFLWSVERVGVVYGLTKIGERDWFLWGRYHVLKNQQPDGSWRDRFPGVPDTCFALLFLRRANVVRDLTENLGSRLIAPD